MKLAGFSGNALSDHAAVSINQNGHAFSPSMTNNHVPEALALAALTAF